MGFVGVLVVLDSAHASWISGGKPSRGPESSSLPRLVIDPTVCSGMINEQVFMSGSDSPMAQGQADIHGGGTDSGEAEQEATTLRQSVSSLGI